MATVHEIRMAFEEAIDALHEKQYKKALEITEKQCQDKDSASEFVKATDGREGFIDECFEYRYHEQSREGFSLLLYAVLYDQVGMMTVLIQHGADPFHVDKFGNNALHLACMFSEVNTTEELLKVVHGIFDGSLVQEKLVNKLNSFNRLPLFYAGEERAKENLKKVSLLLDNGADPTIVVTCDRWKRNALLYFSLFSTFECIQEVLKYEGTSEVDLNVQDHNGNTALHLACERGNRNLIKLLLHRDHDADPNVVNNEGQTPLSVAISARAVSCVYALLDCNSLQLEKDGHIQTLIEEAVDIEEPRILLKILQQRKQTYTSATRGSDLLHKIVRSEAYSDEEFVQAVRYFGKKCIEYEDEDGRTPVMLAALLNKYRKLQLLQQTYLTVLDDNLFYPEWKANQKFYENLVAKRDKHGESAVHLAVRHNGLDADYERTVKVLDELRKNRTIKKVPSLKDEAKRDPLILQGRGDLTGIHLAIQCGKHERAIILLEVSRGRGAELNDSESSTIIHYAIKYKMSAVHFEKMLNELAALKHGESRQLLVQKICGKKNKDGKTALIMALEQRLYRHAELLVFQIDPQKRLDIGDVDCEASFINVRNERDKNALHVAIENDCPSNLIKELMKRYVTVDGNVPIDGKVSLNNIRAVVDHKDEDEAGAEEDSRNMLYNCGIGWLMDAIKEKRADIIKLLLLRGARVTHEHIQEVVCNHKNEEFAMLFVRYALSATDLIHELNHGIKIEKKVAMEVRAQDDREEDNDDLGSVASGGLELVAIKAMDDSSAEEQYIIDNETVLFHGLIKIMPDVAEEALYREAAKQYQGQDTESLITQRTLEVMVEHDRLKLLQHPVVDKHLKSKWDDFGRPLYFAQLIWYLFYVIPLSVLGLLPTLESRDSSFNVESATNSSSSSGHDIAAYTLSGWVILVAILNLIRPFILSVISSSLHRKKFKCREFFLPIQEHFDKYFHLLLFVLVIVFAVLTIADTKTGCCSSVQQHFALFAVLLSWINLIRLFSKFPVIGEHAIIFGKIVWTFLNLAMFTFFVLLAATIVLMIIFFNSQALRSPFFSFGRSFVTVLTMVTGELDYQDVFSLSYSVEDSNVVTFTDSIPEHTANFVWVIFLVLIPILLTNMLTGLAVGDIIDLKEDAALRKLKQKVKLVTDAEKYFRHFKCSGGVGGCSVVFFRKVRQIWSGEERSQHEKDNECKVTAYTKKREEDITQEPSGDESKHARIQDSISDVKNISLSCEKRIAEFKEICDDVFTSLRNENAKIRKDNEQLLEEVQKLKHASRWGKMGISFYK